MTKTRLALLAVACVLAAHTRAAGQYELSITNGLDSQKYLGTGKGVIVGVLDGGVDVTHPAIRGAAYLQKDFTGGGNYDDDKGDSGHGTGVAAIMVGHDRKVYTGLAPSARLINARVITPDDTTSDLWAGNGLIWTARNGAKVVNMSFGNRTDQKPLTDKLNLISDYLSERHGVSMVSAAGNENDTAIRQTPAGSYNGFSVGALAAPDYRKVTWFSNYALDNDARSKPDLVAPGEKVTLAAADWEKYDNYTQGDGTSFAAPMVGGVLAQLIGYGKSKGLPTDPLLMKAVLASSATKVLKYDGGKWEARHGGRDPDYGYRFTQPLDAEQGAGRVDAIAAYRLYAGVRAKSTPLNLWREGKLKGDQSYDVRLGKLYAGQRLDASLAWYRHVAYKDKNGNGLDAKDTFYQTAPLADFVLELLRDGHPIAASDSDVDNLEHFSWTLESDGDYALRVYRFVDGGLKTEQFALAARVLKGDALSVTRMSESRSLQSLTASGVLHGFEVPEPGALAPVLLAITVLLRRGRP